MSRRVAVAPLLAMIGLGCGGADDGGDQMRGRQRLLNAHGLAVGDRIEPVAVSCTDGGTSTVGRPEAVELLTLSTPDDCLTCVPHLAGLDTLTQAGALPEQNYIVAWVPEPQREGAKRVYQALSMRDVCFDVKGALWSNYDVQHTPVTLLLRNRQIVYMHDAPLNSAAARRRFAADLEWALGRR